MTTRQYSNEAPQHFIRDMAIADLAVARYIRSANDGTQYVSPACPNGIQGFYRDLVSVGYANGWFS